MGTNKTVELVDTPSGSTLRIKTKDFRLEDEQRQKLISSLVLSRNVLMRASASLIRSAPTELERSVFATHFRIGQDDLKDQDRLLLRNNFHRLLSALKTDLTIADSYSSIYQLELRTAAHKAAEEWRHLKDELDHAAKNIASASGFEDWQRAGDAEDAFIKQGPERARQAARNARDRQINVEGYVKPHKGYVDLRKGKARVDAVPMKPDQRGSIHINFTTQLSPKCNDMRVATTIIHEGSHKFLDTLDFAYVYQPEYQRMSREEALRNADSYAFAAASLFRGRLIANQAGVH